MVMLQVCSQRSQHRFSVDFLPDTRCRASWPEIGHYPCRKHYLKTCKEFAGSHVVIVDPEVCAEISYIRLFFRLVVGGGFEPP